MRKKIILWLAKKIAVRVIKWRGNLYHFKKAISYAEKQNKRHYIYFIGGKYRVLNRKQIQYWRNKTKGVKVDLSVSRMTNIQLYDTMGHVNSHPTYTQVEVKGIDIQYCRTKDLNTAPQPPKGGVGLQHNV